MSGLLWGALGVLRGFGLTAIGDMVSEEVRDRLDHLPYAILRLAARRLDPEQRARAYEEEWLPELTYILKGDEARPVTRLYHGMRFSLGILISTRRITRHLLPRLATYGLDEQIAGAQSVLGTARARLQEVEAARGEQRVLNRLCKDVAADECILDSLLARRRWAERHR